MKNKRGAVIGVSVLLLIVGGIFAAFLLEKDRARGELASVILSQGSDTVPETIEGLKAAIANYEKKIELHVRDAARTGTYWKILVSRLQDRGLHGEALEALEHAIYYSPLDPALHYYTGVSAGIIAKSLHFFPGSDNSEREDYFALAERAYLRSIELDGRYLRPRYGLAVLYVFELDRPEEAIFHLELCLEISKNDVDYMFVIARAHYMLNNFETAVEFYDRIIDITKDPQKKTDAQDNRQQVLGRMYGS